ncbi:hypothetical protein GBA52_010560 [Prunus armeniaca]|nr:hypothetical protein GBA52_010560 [Prunus armeniaca]
MPDLEPNAAAAAAATATAKATMTTKMIDETYEFSAPRFYDFIKDESDDDKRQAELWFDAALPYAPSPFMPRIKAGRSFTVESMCDFSEAEEMQKNLESSSELKANDKSVETKPQSELIPAEVKVDIIPREAKEESNVSADKSISEVDKGEDQTAKKIASIVKNPSALKQKSHLQSSQTKNIKPSSVKREKNVKNATGTPNLAQENQAIKRQKLDGGRSRQEPEFETSQRVRSVRVKSTAELEEEMMAKIPKFKARPLNKKILEAPSLPAILRSTPQPPEFQEFHLETMARANQNAETASVASTEVSRQNNQGKSHHLTEPKTPVLHTSLRARPPRVKSSFEIEQEELERIPKFKAKPLNKKIFESKGDLGVFCNAKKNVTKPQEFHFATNERIPPPPSSIFDIFDKLSLNSEPHQHPIPRNTTPNPFHLHTEERGAEKERKFITEVWQKQLEEERDRVPKANPYPYTTDYPVIPPKPEPKQCTKPEPFQLESLVRHEEELQRDMEERQRLEKEAAQIRLFKAQPILKEDPIPVPEKVRKPLTQVQQFNLHVDHRAVGRAEFDQKVREKEMMYKRYREESDAARMVEEEKALKQLRRTLVPHARPVPNFEHPFCPQKCPKEPTKAKSPHLRVLERKERRRMMINSAVSSAAAQMR